MEHPVKFHLCLYVNDPFLTCQHKNINKINWFVDNKTEYTLWLIKINLYIINNIIRNFFFP